MDGAAVRRAENAELGAEAEELLIRLRKVVRVRGMSIRTERTYGDWARRFGRFCGGAFPAGTDRVRDFLEYLALERHVAPATQAQALNALVFLYGQVLDWLIEPTLQRCLFFMSRKACGISTDNCFSAAYDLN